MNKWLGEKGVFEKVWIEGENKGFKKKFNAPFQSRLCKSLQWTIKIQKTEVICTCTTDP